MRDGREQLVAVNSSIDQEVVQTRRLRLTRDQLPVSCTQTAGMCSALRPADPAVARGQPRFWHAAGAHTRLCDRALAVLCSVQNAGCLPAWEHACPRHSLTSHMALCPASCGAVMHLSGSSRMYQALVVIVGTGECSYKQIRSHAPAWALWPLKRCGKQSWIPCIPQISPDKVLKGSAAVPHAHGMQTAAPRVICAGIKPAVHRLPTCRIWVGSRAHLRGARHSAHGQSGSQGVPGGPVSTKLPRDRTADVHHMAVPLHLHEGLHLDAAWCCHLAYHKTSGLLPSSRGC